MKKKQHNQPHNVLDSCKKVKEVDNVTCARTQIYDQKKIHRYAMLTDLKYFDVSYVKYRT